MKGHKSENAKKILADSEGHKQLIQFLHSKKDSVDITLSDGQIFEVSTVGTMNRSNPTKKKGKFEMFKWFKKLKLIVARYDDDRNRLLSRVEQAEQTIIDRTEVHADINLVGNCTAIMIGRYKNRDYIQTFNMDQRDFNSVVDWMNELKKRGHVQYVDAPPMLDVVIERIQK